MYRGKTKAHGFYLFSEVAQAVIYKPVIFVGLFLFGDRILFCSQGWSPTYDGPANIGNMGMYHQPWLDLRFDPR